MITQPVCDQLHQMKYRGEGEDHREAMNRVALALKDSDEHYHQFREILLPLRFMPAGRVQAAMGSMRDVTPYNCYVSGTIEDTFVGDAGWDSDPGSIMRRVWEAAATMRRGGGIGYDFSTLRPRGDLIKKLQSQSSGAVSFMRIFDATCRATASSGHRRGAQMGVLRVDHPDILEFIRAKQNSSELTGFNISVGCTDEFYECLASGKPFDLRWGGRIYKQVDAAELWEALMRSNWDWAEPGILNIDTINTQNNLYYCETISATNPCVPGDTPILTRQGYRPIGELVGQDVDVWNGEEFARVAPYSTGTNKLVTVNLSDGTALTCTPAHRFVLSDGRRVAAQDLDEGDALAKFEFPVVSKGTTYQGDAYSQGFYSGDGSEGLEKSFLYKPKWCCAVRLAGTVGDPLVSGKARMWYHGPMLPKKFVPVGGAAPYCLDWLAGLMDADGCAVKSQLGEGVQIGAVDREFLTDVRLMLTRLGVSARVALSHEAGVREFNGVLCKTQAFHSLQITPSDVARLVAQGLRTERLKLSGAQPQRAAARFVRVTSVVDTGREMETFCFTEPKTGRGTFAGIVTAQCGEQPLPPFGACLLGSFNLVKYLNSSLTGYTFEFDQLAADIPVIVRAMDNVIDRARYPLPEQRVEATSKRRMGLGITGLANAGEALGHPYGSPGFIEFEAKVLDFIRDHSYIASAELAREKGPFRLFKRDLYCKGEFFKTLGEEARDMVHRYGIRNSHLTSIAPTGTISFCADNVSSSIEPVFAHKQQRILQEFDGPRAVDVEDYGVRSLGVRGKTCEHVTVDEHLAVLGCAATRVDSAVSKTCNLPPTTRWEDFKNIYIRAHQMGAKGCTTYNTGGKRGAVLTSKDEPTATACMVDPATGVRTCE